jgi:imidazolonepropionase-like amidohydrolase
LKLPILLAVSSSIVGAVFARAHEHPIETDADRRPTLQTGGDCVIRNVSIHSAVSPAVLGDVLVLAGKITAIGSVSAPPGIVEIDGTGKHLAPGVVDCHSHMAIDGGVNEGTLSITAEVSIADVVDPDDLSIWRALAGGVTTVRQLHGSANTIGGQDEVLKLKWKECAEALRFPGAEQGIKFALGENPKQSNGMQRSGRFPGSRMGIEALFLRAFERAREYQVEWRTFEDARGRGEDPPPPRRDIRLDVLAGILAGNVRVHSHCYRADEILMLLRISQQYGFTIRTLQHVLEGYKVAGEMAQAGVGGSTFSDWWAYKMEAYDAIPQNAALMEEAGVLASLNSDSDEMVRRLYAEAAKSVRYAGMDPVAALRLVTLNPAKQLGIGERVGSIEVGKDADLALLGADPLSAFARVELTLVDGEVEFQRRDAFELESRIGAVTPLQETLGSFEGLRTDAPAFALVGGTLHTVTATDIEKGTLVVRDGRIVALGKEVEIPADATRIDVTGLHVWPGMISLGSALGLQEIGSVRATIDTAEIGGNQPDLRVSAALNADSAHIAVTRQNGITRAQPAPQGGGPIRGQSAVVRLLGDTWEELLLRDRDMLHVSFPSAPNVAKEKKEPEGVKELRRIFEDAREHGRLLEEAAPTARCTTGGARSLRARGEARRAACRQRADDPLRLEIRQGAEARRRALWCARGLEGGRRARPRVDSGRRGPDLEPAVR